MISRKDILKAAELIKGTAHKTPVLSCCTINKMFGAKIFFKCENFQKAGAFKFRGALTAIKSLDENSKKKGVAAHSSGNHAQALALAARLNGIKAHLVMPSNSSKVKVEAVKDYGAQITFCEPTLEARESTLKNVMDKTNAIEIHPYNNKIIISGQATATIELIDEIGQPDYILAPVGGGGLLSGTALAAHYFSSSTKVIAAEPENANDAYLSFHSKKFSPSINPQTIADGLRTSLGSITYPIILEYVNDIVTVSERSIIDAMRLIWERMKIIVEPSSAVPLAALLENKIHFEKKQPTIGIIVSGGNIDLGELKSYF
ncbi:MAG: pyridoxal-phosphate dependent enzyme [Bacteroidales bacterium]|nr:pyridoxal-phosphate dependent enzyme [Bacteroidales bacterium]